MTEWTPEELEVVRETWNEEAAYLAYRTAFPFGNKSITAIIRRWNREHPKIKQEAAVC